MGRRHRRRAGPRLGVDPTLLAALGPIEGARLERVQAGVAALNRGLTQDRAHFLHRRYLAQADLRAAYGSYYLCANAPKLGPILDRLSAHLPAAFSVLELGGGPGTGVAGVGLWARARGRQVSHHVTDAVPANVEEALALAAALALPGISGAPLDLRHPLPEGPQVDLALLMNVVNELPATGDARLIADLERRVRGLVLVIEPAEQRASARAIALRDTMVAAGWRIIAPCPHDGPCPTDWCHDEWAFERPTFMSAVDRAVGTRREVLKATWFALTRAPVTRAPDLVRVVSARRDQKGRSRVLGCAASGLHWYEGQRRDRTPGNAALHDASRYDLLQVGGATPVGDGLRLGPAATCTRVDEGDGETTA